MREMKDSGIEWVGKMPTNWGIGKIKQHFDVTLGKMVQSEPLSSSETYENYLCAANIKWLGVDTLVNKKMWFTPYEKSQYLLQNGDVVVMEGGIAGTAAVYLDEFSPCYMQNSVNRCRSKDDYLNKFLYYWLYHVFYVGYIPSICNKATIMHYTKEKLERTPILTVPPYEQKKIVTFLDSKCAEIDALSADIQSEIETLEAYKKSVITEAVTKGLDKNVPMKDSGIEWVGEIPEYWDVHPVYVYFGERKNKNYALQEQNLLSLSYGMIIRKDIDTVGGLLPASFNTYNIIEAGDIIIRPTDLQNDKRSLRTGLATEKGIITSAYIDLAPKGNINSAYFHYLLHSYDVQKVFYNMGNGVRQGLNYSEFSKLMVFAPSLDEQNEIVSYLGKKCLEIESLISEKQEQLSVLSAYKKSLIYEYVTGKKETNIS